MASRLEQARALFFVLLLLGQEAQAIANASGPGGKANASDQPDDKSFELRSDMFAEPDSAVVNLATQRGASSRNLAVAIFADWQWPTGSTLDFVVKNGDETFQACSNPPCTDVVEVCASLLYKEIYLTTAGTDVGTAHTDPKVKLVAGSTDRTKCKLNSYDVPVGIAQLQDGAATGSQQPIKGVMGISNGPLGLINSGDTLSKTSVNIVFMHGGQYLLCYTPDGSFGGTEPGSEVNENIVNTVIKVFGIYSDCLDEDGCLRNERWECSFGYKGESVENCQFNFMFDGGRYGWGIEFGERSRLTWSAAYGSDTALDTGFISATTDPRYCATSGQLPEESMFDLTTATVYMEIDDQTEAIMPPVKSSQESAFTLASCYCPNYNAARWTHCSAADSNECCDDHLEFIQQAGLIYYWTVRLCDYETYRTCNTAATNSFRYMRVIPQQKFVVRIDCPPGGGCKASESNRIKFIDRVLPDNDRPSWQATTGCRNKVTESYYAVWPSSSDSRATTGGQRLDYKAWANPQVKINLSLNKVMDICFANDAPGNSMSWFKVGEVRTTRAFAFSHKAEAASTIEFITYVDHPGTVTLAGGVGQETQGAIPSPFDGNRYSGKALINVMSFDRESAYGVGDAQKTMEEYYGYNVATPTDFQDQMDSECQRESYSPTLVVGPSSKQAAKNYIARVDTNSDNTVSKYQSFTGEAKSNEMTVKRSGVVAICYCGMVNGQDECSSSSFWIFAGMTTVQGPKGGTAFTLPTQVVIKFDIEGWGFSNSDKLRLVPPTAQCSGTPNSDTGFKVECPAVDGNGCRTATPQEVIDTSVLTSSLVGIYIMSVEVFQTYSVLQFSGDISSYLNPNPVTGEQEIITIDFDRIMVNDKATMETGSTITATERFEAYRLSGIYEFQGPGDISATPETFHIGHKVSPYVSVGVTDPTRMKIPVGWTSTDIFPFTVSPFKFKDGQGHWMRRNKLETGATIKGTKVTANGPLKLCWGRQAYSASTKFYTEAATVDFVEPDPMATAVVSLTTKQRYAVAPVIIAFKTTATRSEYSTSTGDTTLMLRFMDVSNKLEPYQFSQSNGVRGINEVPDDQEIGEASKKQYVCGKLFTELWSDHSEGFPMPTGCYYTKKLSDQPDSGSSGNVFFREFYMTFGPMNGLRQNVEYQMVMNAEVKDITANQAEIVDIYAMCLSATGCERPFQVFEKGSATASMTTETQATSSDPQFGTDGFKIQRGDAQTDVFSLSSLNILQVVLKGGDGLMGITKESFIRIYMHPLTAWDLGEAACSAECIPYHFEAAKCAGEVGCDSESVVGGSKRNIVKITLPTEMDNIDTDTTHTIKITRLTLPSQGFFPSKVPVQLTRPDNTKPFFTKSTGMLMKEPDVGQTTGRLVIDGRSGYGPNPFKGDEDNTLYLRLQLGATLWNVGRNDAAFLEVEMPAGYVGCSIEDDGLGIGVPPKDLKVFALKTGGYVDNNRGVLSSNNDDGDWSNSGLKLCSYELNPNNQAIYAGMVFYVTIHVGNPGQATPKTEEKNNWRIKLTSLGEYDPSYDPDPVAWNMPLAPFISLAEEFTLGQEYWGGNAAVINMMAEELVQPSSFVRSCCGPTFETRKTEEYLRVYFQTDTYAGQNGYVVFDAPAGFDFGASCTAKDLADRHYAFVGQEEMRLYRLKAMGTCQGQRYPLTGATYNRASLRVGGVIEEKFYYGFQIKVTHPTVYDTAQHQNWYLWIQDTNGYGLEGSLTTIRFNKYQADSQTEFWHKSFGMYNEIGPDIGVQIVNLRPRSLTNQDTEVIFYPIRFDVDTDTSLRISAPIGFVWDEDANTFVRRTNGTTEDFPLAVVENNNQLVWDSLSLKGNVNYGFRASVTVPNFNPVISSNSFFIEFGFRESDIVKRRFANVVESQTIQSVTDAEVTFSTNLVNYQDNRIEFALQTVTQLNPGDGIVVLGTEKTAGFSFACPHRILEESDPLPEDVLCNYQLSASSSPLIILKVDKTPIAPGYYKFEMAASNPATLKLEPGDWEFSTYTNVKDYPVSERLDKELYAAGFRINDMMPEARLTFIDDNIWQKTNRNDRPGKPNQLIFQFALRARPSSDRVLSLKGPRGFVFDDNCLPYLITDFNDIFGTNTGDSWPPDYTEWPQQFAPTKCQGGGRVASITIPTGLGRNNKYSFRIAVRQNPMISPEWNKWTMEFNDESSDPFVGFRIWTNTNMKVTPVGSMKSLVGAGITPTAVPVTFEFTPYNTITFKQPGEARGGLLQLTAPVGFEFVQNNEECEVMLYLTDGSYIFEDYEYMCRVENKVKLLLYMMGEVSIRGSYTYTVIVFVEHPPSMSAASTWRMDSFSKWTAEPDTALDESTVLGYNINNVVNIFEVKNTNNVLNGNTKINDIDIKLQFPDPIKDDDELLIIGPKGFNLIGNPELQNCNEFRWVGGNNPLPATGDPGCTCDQEGFCTMRFPIDESKDPAYPQNMDLHFKIATTNPAKTPFLTDNYWKVFHMKGGVVQSSHIQGGWSINPQLEDVKVNLVGASLASGKVSDIEVKFTPVTDAGTIKIEALYPSQFNFDQSTVALPYDISKKSEGSTIIIDRGGFKEGTPVAIRINTVRLGRAGGQTRFNLVTYKDGDMLEKKDEKLDFDRGFRLPGLITVHGNPVLKSQYQDDPSFFPVKSLFQPRILEDAKAEFTVSFSRQVQASERLIITCQGQGAYTLKSSPFVIIGIGQVETSVELDSAGAVKATLKPGRPATEVALQPDTPYTIIMWVLPVPGTNTWRFDTSDGGELPSNTNDGDLDGFNPVQQMVLSVQAVRSPPKAIVDVVLNIDPGSAIVRELIIIAPPSFLFDSSAGGCGDMCMPGEALSSTSMKTATIASPTGEPLTQLTGLRIRVMTPEQTPSRVTWYVEGRGQGAGTTTGWGEGAGFFVTQMGGTSVTYPAVASVKNAQIAFTFALDVSDGNQISIIAPPGFLMTCSAEGSLKQISLPGDKPDCIDDPMQIRLQTTLTTGQYAFALAVDLPPETPTVNTFTIVIRDQDQNVVDAAYAIQGKEIVNIGVTDPSLTWSSSKPNERTQIEIGLTFTRDTPNVQAVLITLPDKFMHDVQTPTDVQNLNKRFPVAAGSDWADTQYKNKIKIAIDTSAGGAVIPADTHKFSFPALVPPTMSRTNLWSIALCADNYCETSDDKYVIVSFPIAGFAIYEEPPEALRVTTNFGERRAQVGSVCALLLALLVSSFGA